MKVTLHEKWSDEVMGKPPGGYKSIEVWGNNPKDGCYAMFQFSFKKYTPSLKVNNYVLMMLPSQPVTTALSIIEISRIIFEKAQQIFLDILKEIHPFPFKDRDDEFEFTSYNEMNEVLNKVFKLFEERIKDL